MNLQVKHLELFYACRNAFTRDSRRTRGEKNRYPITKARKLTSNSSKVIRSPAKRDIPAPFNFDPSGSEISTLKHPRTAVTSRTEVRKGSATNFADQPRRKNARVLRANPEDQPQLADFGGENPASHPENSALGSCPERMHQRVSLKP